MQPSEFWKLTPYQFWKLAKEYVSVIEEQHDHAAWIMWHSAVLPKLKKMPELKSFMSGNKKQVKNIDEVAIMARLKAYNKKVKECQS